MRKSTILVFLILVLCSVSFAGELRELPQYLVLSDPTTNQSEFLTLTHHYSATQPYAIVTINVLDSQGVRHSVPVMIENVPDDPDTPEDESTTTYTDFVAGYGTTMKSRGDALVWTRLQELYETQATP